MRTIIDIICNNKGIKILSCLKKEPLPVMGRHPDDLWNRTGIDPTTLYGYLSEMREYGITTKEVEYDKKNDKVIRKHALTKKGKELSELVGEMYLLIQELEEGVKNLKEKLDFSREKRRIFIVSNPK